MRRWMFVFVAVAMLAVGCASRKAAIVGTWKARAAAPVSSKNLGDVMRASSMSLWTQGMTIEFNRESSFKISQMMGSGTGTYRWVGDKLELTLNTFGPNRTIELRFGADGKTLETVSEFASDPKVVFDKTGP
jgi:hypothetical protein